MCCVAVCLPLLAGCRARTTTQDVACTLNTADGVAIAAHLFMPAKQAPPGLILVHRLGADQTGWVSVARQAQQAGYVAITFDLRGHGQSRGTPANPIDYRHFEDADWQNALLDIDAAREKLRAAGADPENLFIAGESLGGSLALEYTEQHDDIQGVILVSPVLSSKGIDSADLIARQTTRPTLMLWCEGDAYAASSGRTLERLAPIHVEVHSYAGAAEGTNIFAVAPEAAGQIIVWLNQMLAHPGANAGDKSGGSKAKS